MFAVLPNRDSRWLYESLRFLFFNHIEELDQQCSYFKDFLEIMAVRYARGRLDTTKRSKKYGQTMIFLFMHSILLITSYGKTVKN